MKKLLLLPLLFAAMLVNAKSFYISNSGNDAASGSIAAPWATLAKVNASMATLAAGDSVLFQRGGEFFGTLNITKAGIIIGAYGTGNLPVITGFKRLTGWTNSGTNLWNANSASPKSYMNVVVINGAMVREGRYPDYADNAGSWLSYTNSLPASSPVTVNSASSIPNSFVGGELVLRKESYILDVMPITAQSGNSFTCNNPAGLYGISGGLGSGLGFFIQNHPATLTTANEWYFNPSTKSVSIYSTASPLASIKGSVFDTLVNVSVSNVTIENVIIEGSNRFGVLSTGSGFVLKNSTVRYIGYWGIQVSGSSSTVLNNTIRDIGSNGIWLNNSGLIQGNQVKSVGVIDGMGGNNGDQALGIALESSSGIICRNNVLDSIGYNGIKFGGSNITIRENVISNICMSKTDGGAIYTWANNGLWNFSNRTISKNILINNGKILYGIPGDLATAYYPMYMDGGTGDVTIDSNVIAFSNVSQNSNASSLGIWSDHAILLNNPRRVRLTNNITFGWPTALSINDWSPSITQTPKPTGNTITGNCFFVNDITDGANWKMANRSFLWLAQGSTSLAQMQADMQNMGVMDNNYIPDFVQSPYHWTSYSVDGPFPVNLSSWKTFSGKDLNSIATPSGVPEFKYNATGSTVTYLFKGRQKIDYRGNVYNDSATIPAFYANIFFDNGVALDVDAGTDIVVTLPADSARVTATPTRPVTRYSWTRISGPAQFTILNPSQASTVIKGLASGTYAFRIEVTDSRGMTAADTINISVPIVLPVTLVEFSAKKVLDNKNLVTWKTATEMNMSHYVVERSNDGRGFGEIGRILSNNNANEVSQYSFTDNQPLFGANYYRLKMVDRDGRFRFSNIVLVGRKTSGNIIIDNLALNSASGLVTVGFTTDRTQKVTYSLVSSNGSVLSNQSVQLQAGYNKFLSRASLSTGVYYFRVVSDEQTLIRAVFAQ